MIFLMRKIKIKNKINIFCKKKYNEHFKTSLYFSKDSQRNSNETLLTVNVHLFKAGLLYESLLGMHRFLYVLY